MKLVFPEIETVLQFAEGSFPSVIIENPGLFYRFVNDLYHQSCGYDGAAVLSIDDSPIPIAGNLELLSDYFPFEINRKPLLNKILSRLEKQAVAPEYYSKSQQLVGQLERLIYDLAFQNDLELELPRLSIGALLKASGICLKEDYSSLAEKLLIYMDLFIDNGLAKLFVLVNCRSFLDDRTLEFFTESCCRKEYKFLLLDNKAYPLLTREKRTLVDIDLCEI